MIGKERKTKAYKVLHTPRFSYRWMVEFLVVLASNRVSRRYKESLFGLGWLLLQPVALTMIFTYIKKVADIPSGGAPYPIFAATGLVFWTLTTSVVSQSAVALSSYTGLIKKVAIPRWLFPLSILASSFIDLAIMFFILIGFFVFFKVGLTASIVWLPLVFAVHLLLLMGLGLFFSLATLWLRDVGHALPHLTQLWFFASPVFYPFSMVPSEFEVFAKWNPIAGIIESYRACLLFNQAPPMDLFIPSAIVSGVLFFIAFKIFSGLQHYLADIV